MENIDTGPAPTLDRNGLKMLLDQHEKALAENRETLSKQLIYEEEYLNLNKTLKALPNKLRMESLVPFGPLAFVKAELIHTNEITVHLADNWFVKCTASGAQKISNHRLQKIRATIDNLEKESSLLLSWMSESRKQLNELEETFEIKEFETEEEVEKWKELHKLNVKKFHENKRKNPQQIEEEKKEVDELLEKLELLELQEELEEYENSQKEKSNQQFKKSNAKKSILKMSKIEEVPESSALNVSNFQSTAKNASENKSNVENTCPSAKIAFQIENTCQNTSEIPNTSQNSAQIENSCQNTSEIPKTSQNTAQIENTSQIPNTSQNSAQIENTCQNTSQIPNTSQNTVRIENNSEIPNTSQNSAQIENTCQITSEIPNSSQNSAQIVNTSEIPKTSQNSAQIENASQNTSQIPKTSQNTAQIENTCQNISKTEQNEVLPPKKRVSFNPTKDSIRTYVPNPPQENEEVVSVRQKILLDAMKPKIVERKSCTKIKKFNQSKLVSDKDDTVDNESEEEEEEEEKVPQRISLFKLKRMKEDEN